MSKAVFKLNRSKLELQVVDVLAKRGKTSNFTFVLKPEVVREFKRKCAENNLSMSFVIEALMSSYEGVEGT